MKQVHSAKWGHKEGSEHYRVSKRVCNTTWGMKQVHNAKWGYKEGSEHYRVSKRACNYELRFGVLTTSTSHSAELGFISRNKYLLP